MSSLARIDAGEPSAEAERGEQRDYIPVILGAMAEQNIGQRKLAMKAGVSKTRLALLLHRNPNKRLPMTLAEFQKILGALDLNIIQAIIRVETFRDQTMLADDRYATLIAMLSEVFRGLPAMLIEALDEMDGVDGTEIRREWAGPLQAAVVARLVKEVSSVMVRRASFSEIANHGI